MCIYNFEPFMLDTANEIVTIDKTRIPLTKKEFNLASYLFHHNGNIVSRQSILENVWGITASLDTRTIDAHVSRLRQKLQLSKTDWKITCIYRAGYCLYHEASGVKSTSNTAGSMINSSQAI